MVKKLLSKKIITLVLVCIAILGLVYAGFLYKTQPVESAAEDESVKEHAVRRGDITIDFIGDGKAEIPVVNLDFGISGILRECYAAVGQDIKAGDVVAKLDDTDYRNKRQDAQINYEKAAARLEQTKQQYQLSLLAEQDKLNDLKAKFEQISLEYLPMLEIQDVYSEQAVELKRVSYEEAKSAYGTQLERYNILSKDSKDIEMEQANVEAAKIALKVTQDNLNNTVLTAPMDAKILAISYKPGETIPTVKEAGEVTANTNHFMVISDAEKVEVIVPVSEIDLSNIAIDQKVEVEFEAFNGQTFYGKTVFVDALPKIDASGLVTYDVTIELDGGLDKIKTGMTCTVSFILNQRKNVPVIPNRSVRIVEGKQVVQVKDEQGHVEPRTIKTGLTDGTNAEVTDGLEIGEILVIKEKN